MKLSAVLFAGGESLRMGHDKAVALFRSRPLWDHQLELLRDTIPFEILVSARADPTWRPPDATFVQDTHPSRGPLSGLAASLAQMQGTHLLAVAIDMPLLSASFLRSMADATQPGKGILPRIGTRAEPLAAVYPKECLDIVSVALLGEDHSLQRLTRKLVDAAYLRVMQLNEDDQPMFRSLNTPSDLR